MCLIKIKKKIFEIDYFCYYFICKLDHILYSQLIGFIYILFRYNQLFIFKNYNKI